MATFRHQRNSIFEAPRGPKPPLAPLSSEKMELFCSFGQSVGAHGCLDMEAYAKTTRTTRAQLQPFVLRKSTTSDTSVFLSHERREIERERRISNYKQEMGNKSREVKPKVFESETITAFGILRHKHQTITLEAQSMCLGEI